MYEKCMNWAILELWESGNKRLSGEKIKEKLDSVLYKIRFPTTVCTCKITTTSVCVQQLRFVPPWLISTHRRGLYHCSLYVDDFLICYRSKYINIIERHIERCLNKLSNWADTNGFKFSTSKTCLLYTSPSPRD